MRAIVMSSIWVVLSSALVGCAKISLLVHQNPDVSPSQGNSVQVPLTSECLLPESLWLDPNDCKGAKFATLNSSIQKDPTDIATDDAKLVPVTYDVVAKAINQAAGNSILLQEGEVKVWKKNAAPETIPRAVETAEANTDPLVAALWNSIAWPDGVTALSMTPSATSVAAGTRALEIVRVLRQRMIGASHAVTVPITSASTIRFHTSAACCALPDVALITLSQHDIAALAAVGDIIRQGGANAMTPCAMTAVVQQKHNYDAAAGDAARQSAIRAAYMPVADEFNTGRLLMAYFSAYFRGGYFYQLGINTKDVNDALTKRANDLIKQACKKAGHPDDALCQNLETTVGTDIQNATTQWCKSVGAASDDECFVTPVLGQQGLMTRYGMNVQFAGIVADVGIGGNLKSTLTYPKAKEFAPQLVRVFLEATFDANGPIVPATSNSTACVSKIYPSTLCFASSDTSPATTNKNVACVDHFATQAEASVAAMTSSLVRGVWAASLNNEALADTIETASGVIARKATEKALWPYYDVPSGAHCDTDSAPLVVDLR